MSAVKLLIATRVCTHCNYRTLNPLATLTGLSIIRQFNIDHGRERHFPIGIRRFSISNARFEDGNYLSSIGDHDSCVTNVQNHDTSINHHSTVPWYLQVNTQDTTNSAPRRDNIPEVPANAPTRLRPILNRLSVDIGLEELTLIDLRNIDPPPALGASLLMVIGSARSEKHLHVSADRFCRWLRSEYGMSPYADGLLGRNELKIKLRRKARRMKLVGSTPKKIETDDGIRSNWICVNVGPIENFPRTAQSLEKEGIIGFGGCEDGAQLVVQMMTEDKREEIDLENLWNRVLERHTRKRNIHDSEDLDQNTVDESINVRVSHPRPIFTNRILTSHSQSISLPRIHHRRFHSRPPRQRAPPNEVPLLPNSSKVEPQHYAESEGSHDKFASLLNHLATLERLPKRDALSALGHDAYDRESTSFLSKFYRLIPLFCDRRHWGARLALVQYGINLGHDKYTTDDLISILNETHEAASTLPSNSYGLVIQSIIDTMSTDIHDFRNMKRVSPLAKILAILEGMELRNLNIKSTPIMRNLYIAFEKTRLLEVDSGHSFLHSLSAARLARFFDDRTSLVPPLSLPVLAMDQLAAARRWHEFWRYWRQLPINLIRRPQVLYTAMFNHIARTGHQRMCVDALTEWVPNLTVEQPPVEITADLAEAILACLSIVDSHIEEQSRNLSKEKGQWMKLYKKCVEGLDRPAEDTDKMQAEADRMYGFWRPMAS